MMEKIKAILALVLKLNIYPTICFDVGLVIQILIYFESNC
jgi:hypothetical protein